jgi:hypothetical protein
MEKQLDKFTIDPTLPIRGMPFTSLKQLLYHINTHMPIRYSDALTLVTENRVILSARGEPLKKSAFYHYWTALRMLGLIAQELTTKHYVLTERGKQLIRVYGSSNDALTQEEQALFREGMLGNLDIWSNFLILFTGQISPTLNPSTGHFVIFRPVQGGKKYEIRSPFVEEPIEIVGSTTQSIIFGLRRWGQQCGLIDEVFPPANMDLYTYGTSFMYLIDHRKDSNITVSNITPIIRKLIGIGKRLPGSVIQFNIPKILTNLCVEEGIKLSTAQELLNGWALKHSHDVAIERPSSGLVDEQRGRRNKSRVEASQPWIVRNGLIYTTLLVNEALLSEERNEDGTI